MGWNMISMITNHQILSCNSTIMLITSLKCSQGQDDHQDLQLIMKSSITRGKRFPARGYRGGYDGGPRGGGEDQEDHASIHHLQFQICVYHVTKLNYIPKSKFLDQVISLWWQLKKPTHVRKKNWFHIRGFNLGGLSSNYVKCACSFNLSLFIYSCQN